MAFFCIDWKRRVDLPEEDQGFLARSLPQKVNKIVSTGTVSRKESYADLPRTAERF